MTARRRRAGTYSCGFFASEQAAQPFDDVLAWRLEGVLQWFRDFVTQLVAELLLKLGINLLLEAVLAGLDEGLFELLPSPFVSKTTAAT